MLVSSGATSLERRDKEPSQLIHNYPLVHNRTLVHDCMLWCRQLN